LTGAGPSALRASVIIPTYNRWAFLRQTLTSLNTQILSPEQFEVIVGIDGSSDGTEEALGALRPSFSLRWVSQPNRGIAAARNAAARQARHEVLIFLDDDQIASNGLVAAHLAAQSERPVVVQGLYPLASGYDRRGASLMYERALFRALAPLDVAHPTTPYLWGAHISCRRETWARVGGFDESFREYGAEDTDFALRIAALNIPFLFEPRALSHHLHVVGYRSYRRQAVSEGRAMVRLAAKHALPLDALSGGSLRRPVDRAIAAVWRLGPWGAELCGWALLAGLRGADLVRVRAAQLAAARLAHRFYKVGGITLERHRSPARPVPVETP
jgi:GT2 family glycosyltransferase